MKIEKLFWANKSNGNYLLKRLKNRARPMYIHLSEKHPVL